MTKEGLMQPLLATSMPAIAASIHIHTRVFSMRKALRIAGVTILALLLVLLAGLGVIVGRAVWYYAYEFGIPDHRRVESAKSNPVCPHGPRDFVSLADMPLLLRQAFLAAEDADFYSRPPFNPVAEITKAILFEYTPPRGIASMSTFLARCLVRQRPRCCIGIDWSVVSTIVIYRLERDVSKDAIFEAYLNEIFIGRDSIGVAAAADAYFGKQLGDLSVDEVAFIAALRIAPTSIAKNLQRGTERRNAILDRMVGTGFINSAEADIAKQTALRLREVPAPR